MPSAPAPDELARPAPTTLAFTPCKIAIYVAVFAAIVYAANRAVYALHAVAAPFDGPRFWPFSVFQRRLPTPLEAILAVLVWIAGLAVIQAASRSDYRWGGARVAACAFALCIGSNLVQGAENGFFTPIAGVSGPAPVHLSPLRRDTGASGRGIQYWHDASGITDVGAFLRGFNAKQAGLREHARTHPPGAPLFFYTLRRATGDRPAVAALLICALSVGLSAWGIRRLVSATQTPEAQENAADAFPALLFLLLPAVQIYFCATLDAVICALLVVAIAAFAQTTQNDNHAPDHEGTAPPRHRNAAAGYAAIAAVALAGASLLTFGALWAAGPLASLAFTASNRPRAIARLALIVVAALLPLLALRVAFGFDYLAALQTASRLENPHGFRLISEPLSYAVTRLEDVAELACFFGPFLLALALRGFSDPTREKPSVAHTLPIAGAATLALLFLSGAYRTGETARACLFLYPLLVLPALSPPTAKRQTLALVWTQALLMQTFGSYFW